MTLYKLTSETKGYGGVILHRIELTADCRWGKKGTKGGWVQSTNNLRENAWVGDDAIVYEDAQVYGDAWVSGDACVLGKAQVYGDARVFGNALVYGDAKVYGSARVSGDARVYGDAILTKGKYTIQHINGGEWDKIPLTILGSKHTMNISAPGIVRVGCYHKPIGEWLNEYEGIDNIQGYSEDEIAEYKAHLDYFSLMMK